MFPKHYHFRVFAFLMSLLLATLMTGIITWINTGLDAGFPGRWGHALVIAWSIAFLIVLMIGPHVRACGPPVRPRLRIARQGFGQCLWPPCSMCPPPPA